MAAKFDIENVEDATAAILADKSKLISLAKSFAETVLRECLLL